MGCYTLQYLENLSLLNLKPIAEFCALSFVECLFYFILFHGALPSGGRSFAGAFLFTDATCRIEK
jgi:hypothetical protein